MTGEQAEQGCVFCNVLEQADPRGLVVWQGSSCFVVLNLYPYNSGHVMVVPRRHTGTLASLTSVELQELAVLTQRSEAALSSAYNPQGINVGVNIGRPAGAGVLDHVHVHLVPRWNGDTNFMTVTGDTRVLPESLADSARRLRPIFEQLAAE